MNLRDARDEEAREVLRRGGRIRAILPIGSLEQHGKHLPLGTDSIIAERIAAIVAERTNALLLPCIYYGISYEHEPLFNVSISAQTLCMLVGDICRSLVNLGVKNIIILNAHYGNEYALLSCTKELAETYRDSGVLIYSITYSLFIDRMDHAGENETSLMLAIRPDLVRMDLIEEGLEEGKRNEGDIDFISKLDPISLSRITLLPGSISSIARYGVIGDPRMASKESGHEMLDDVCTNIIKTIEEVEHMYEKISGMKMGNSNRDQDDLYMQSTEDER
ncbi:MAG: creatininase family protein [Candidatus Nitrosocaldus sp.]